ncbi:MAG: dihydroorotase family protein [Aigarchaeota archaeon]|nr:dihydroorotase family protein [Aigarchaeota archaeon]MDW8092383.1 dihydroorotase family protein [Nitrososphaerota archaeon]
MGGDLIVRNGAIVNPWGVVNADVLIENGRISAIGRGLRADAEEIDASGMYVLPGFVDEHVHFREPGLEYKEDFLTGSMSSVCGGVTTVCDMPNTNPSTDTPERLREKYARIRGRSYADYGLYALLTDHSKVHVEEMLSCGAIGLKAFLAPSTGEISSPSDGTLVEALELSSKLGFTVALHCEDGELVDHFMSKLLSQRPLRPSDYSLARPIICETTSIMKVSHLAIKTGGRALILHVTSGESLTIIKSCKRSNRNVFAETCPHYLYLSERDYDRLGTMIKVNPPIRSERDRRALWRGLIQGIIDTIGSDHAPHTLEEKTRDVLEAPPGIVGAETIGPLMLDAAMRGIVSIEKVAEVLSTNPAKALSIFPKKGAVSVGSDGDLVVFDPHAEFVVNAKKLHSKQKFTPYDMMKLMGRIRYTILRGNVVVKDGEPLGPPTGERLTLNQPGANQV